MAFPVSRGDSQNRVEGAPANQTGYKRNEAEYLEDRSEQIIADDKPAEIFKKVRGLRSASARLTSYDGELHGLRLGARLAARITDWRQNTVGRRS